MLQMSSETRKPTLYERLGGVYSIAAAVDDFIDRVMHNSVLRPRCAVVFAAEASMRLGGVPGDGQHTPLSHLAASWPVGRAEAKRREQGRPPVAHAGGPAAR